jgi:hypothetical protein
MTACVRLEDYLKPIWLRSNGRRGYGEWWPKHGDIGHYPGADWASVRENSTVIHYACWKQVWAEMTDSELEDRLFTYLWLPLHTPNSHAGRVAQLIEEAETARPNWDGRTCPREGRKGPVMPEPMCC